MDEMPLQTNTVLIPLHVKHLEEQMKVREQLLKYCELDTLAMVRVLGKLK